MKAEQKIKIIDRFDIYYSGINNKGAFILTINTLIISGFLIGIKDLKSMVNYNDICLFNYIVGLIIVLSLVSMIITIIAIIPYLNSSNSSLWFFNDIANRELSQLKSDINSASDEFLDNDLNEQIYYLATGLKKKHKRIRCALILNFIQMILHGTVTYLIL